MNTCINYTDNQIIQMLHQANVRPSLHRLAVLKYVANGRTHPTADEIYSALVVDCPTMSRTTVYNSLHALSGAGLLKELEIESGYTRYDLLHQAPHSHFVCRRCGKVFDMAVSDRLKELVDSGFEVDSVELSFKGLCPACLAEDNKN